MNKVYGPADYTSVAAPAYISKDNLIMKWAIYNGNIEAKDQMKLNYYAYLKAMKSKFTFFLPSDVALQRYFDPVSFTSKKPRVLALTYTGKGDFPVDKRLFNYDVNTATMGEEWKNEKISNDEIVNRLKDILESHTIVHDGTNPIDSEDEYFMTKNGSPIKMTRDANNTIIAVQGGYQLENERAGITNGELGSNSIRVTTDNTNNMDNGRTYVIDDAPIIPASKSVYGILRQGMADESAEAPFSEFYSLTSPDDNIILACGLVSSSLKNDVRTRALKKYHVFVDDKGVDYNIQFFNNYRYTVFVPSNEAIAKAVEEGLPTWNTIREYYESLPLDEDENPILTHKDSLKLQTQITFLNNFIRGHFLDNSIFADKSEREEADFVTSSYNDSLGVFVKVHCQRVKQGGKTILQVRDDLQDENGNLISPFLTVDDTYQNIMARDISCTKSPTDQNSMNNILIQGSSFAVIHQIDGVLHHTAHYPYPDFDNEEECKAYLRNFPIVDTKYEDLDNTGLRKVRKIAIR